MNRRTRAALERVSAQRLDGASRPVTRAPELVTWALDADAVAAGTPGWTRASSRRPWAALSVVVAAAVLSAVALSGHDGAASAPAPGPGFAGAPSLPGFPDGWTCSPIPDPSSSSSSDPSSSAYSGFLVCTDTDPGQPNDGVPVFDDPIPCATGSTPTPPVRQPTGSPIAASPSAASPPAGGLPCVEPTAGQTGAPAATGTPTGSSGH